MVSVPALAAVALSPPHSEHSTGSDNTRVSVDSDIDKPMDLSSGGTGLGITQLFSGGSNIMPISEHPLLNARRLADLVRQQHRESEQRERESKRKWEETEDEEEHNHQASEDNGHPHHHPVDLIRSRWEAGAGAVPQSDRVSPGPGSPAGSSSGSESGQSGAGGREEKRRRLDMLLNKKFDNKMVDTCNPILMSTPPPSERETSPASDRRPSTESTGGGQVAGDRKNRRKQSQPGSNPGSPPSISIRPHSDLFPPAATSTPRQKDDPNSKTTNGSNVPADYSPARKMSRSQSPVPPSNNTVTKSPVAAKLFAEEKENKDVIKNQLLQMQLASSGLAGLGSSPPPELLKALQYNPLLYYSYYAQMLTALQAQHKLLEMNNSSSTNANINNNINNNNNNGSANNIKDILSPLKLGNMAALNKESNQESRSVFNPYYPPNCNSPASSLSPIGYKDDEPRKRAPRALTGRYVRTGTAASPRVLQILRKKIEDRLKLKELLGENSHLYFGAVKQNSTQSPYKNQVHQKQKKKL